MRCTSGGSCIAASNRTLRSVIQCDGVVTTIMAQARDKWRPHRTVAYKWCMPSPQRPPSGEVQKAPTAALESGTSQYSSGCSANLWTYDKRITASPSWEVPTPEATWVR